MFKRKNGHQKNATVVNEHPKTTIEVMEGTRAAIESYAAAQKMTFDQAAQVLILNELRCLHWHEDMHLAAHSEPVKEKK